MQPPSGNQWRLAAGEHEAVVVEVGGGLRTYQVAGRDVLDGYGADDVCPHTAGQILAPWPNRVRDGRYQYGGATYQLPLSEPAHHNAAHGLVRWQPWQATSVAADSVTLECRLSAQPGYPWSLHLTTTWTLGPDGVRAEHTATNLAGTACPFGLGAHPYISLPGAPVDDLELRLPARNRLLVDARMLPIGAARVAGGDFDFHEGRRIGDAHLDTAFGEVPAGGSTVTLSTVEGTAVEVWADEAFAWWQVYTGDTLPAARNRRSVAIEPMTCPPDAFNSGRDLVSLKPGDTWRGTWGIRPRNGR